MLTGSWEDWEYFILGVELFGGRVIWTGNGVDSKNIKTQVENNGQQVSITTTNTSSPNQ